MVIREGLPGARGARGGQLSIQTLQVHFTSTAAREEGGVTSHQGEDRPREAGWHVAGDSAVCRSPQGPEDESWPWKDPAVVLSQSASLSEHSPSPLKWAAISSLGAAHRWSAGLDLGITVPVPILVSAAHSPIQRRPLVPASLGDASPPGGLTNPHYLQSSSTPSPCRLYLLTPRTPGRCTPLPTFMR